jgi:hypothetical protein
VASATVLANNPGRLDEVSHLPLPYAARHGLLVARDVLWQRLPPAPLTVMPHIGVSAEHVQVTMTLARGEIQPTAIKVAAGSVLRLEVHNLEPAMHLGLAVQRHAGQLALGPGARGSLTLRPHQPGSYTIYLTHSGVADARAGRARLVVTP